MDCQSLAYGSPRAKNLFANQMNLSQAPELGLARDRLDSSRSEPRQEWADLPDEVSREEYGHIPGAISPPQYVDMPGDASRLDHIDWPRDIASAPHSRAQAFQQDGDILFDEGLAAASGQGFFTSNAAGRVSLPPSRSFRTAVRDGPGNHETRLNGQHVDRRWRKRSQHGASTIRGSYKTRNDTSTPNPSYQQTSSSPLTSSSNLTDRNAKRQRTHQSYLDEVNTLRSPEFHHRSNRQTPNDNHAQGRTQQWPQRSKANAPYKAPVQMATIASSSNLTPSQHLPSIQGIQLVPLTRVPDRFRSIFPYPMFNAVQSKCFNTAYESDANLVVSAPTGSGKTAILEMAICRLLAVRNNCNDKVVYMAPTKSLCSERQRDWSAKFTPMGLQCSELTGDTEATHLRSVQSANIIVTTPEKWDSVTRKWKDHAKLLEVIKLFLIDEVHMLKDERGATLEAVVSRMKSIDSEVRFLALSATIPNSDDIAIWLGYSKTAQNRPAVREDFAEDFRPVQLQKHVVGVRYSGNDFGFEKICDPLLPEVIQKYSQKKPIMVFCITRNAAVATAKLLAQFWQNQPNARFWNCPSTNLQASDADLRGILDSGVAFHHAGLSAPDRQLVEKSFLEGEVNVICCTSTLAVGVNLPCHFVIIKNTFTYQNSTLREYSALEITQMLGRAGRPQFDDSAVAVILTKHEKKGIYERLVSGHETLESRLHENLIEHVNSEICLGTVYNLQSAITWLTGTFLYVRLLKNLEHYRIAIDDGQSTPASQIDSICRRELKLLDEAGLTTSGHNAQLTPTAFGDAMARYCVKYETMKILLCVTPKPRISDIARCHFSPCSDDSTDSMQLSALAQADEYQEVRLRAKEKKLFKEINRQTGIKYPIKVELAQHAHKRSLIIQAELGAVDFPSGPEFAKLRPQFTQEKSRIFNNAHRLLRCFIDCNLAKEDAVAVRNGLELARGLSAQCWDNSPFQLRQLPQIGPVAVRKLCGANIMSIEDIESVEPHRIEMILSRNPPFGRNTIAEAQAFPRLRVTLRLVNTERPQGEYPSVKFKADCGFLNETPPLTFHRKPVHVCILTESSDGHLIDFRRISAKHMGSSIEVVLIAKIYNQSQYISCHVMCEEFAGTFRSADLKPRLPSSCFPRPQRNTTTGPQANDRGDDETGHNTDRQAALASRDIEFNEEDLDDEAMVDAAERTESIDHMRKQTEKGGAGGSSVSTWRPQQLENGKWACNHKCRDKTKEGVDKPPKEPKTSAARPADLVASSTETADGRDESNGCDALHGSVVQAGSEEDLATTNSNHRRSQTSMHYVVNKVARAHHVSSIDSFPRSHPNLPLSSLVSSPVISKLSSLESLPPADRLWAAENGKVLQKSSNDVQKPRESLVDVTEGGRSPRLSHEPSAAVKTDQSMWRQDHIGPSSPRHSDTEATFADDESWRELIAIEDTAGQAQQQGHEEHNVYVTAPIEDDLKRRHDSQLDPNGEIEEMIRIEALFDRGDELDYSIPEQDRGRSSNSPDGKKASSLAFNDEHSLLAQDVGCAPGAALESKDSLIHAVANADLTTSLPTLQEATLEAPPLPNNLDADCPSSSHEMNLPLIDDAYSQPGTIINAVDQSLQQNTMVESPVIQSNALPSWAQGLNQDFLDAFKDMDEFRPHNNILTAIERC